MKNSKSSAFEKAAARQRNASFISELWEFLRTNKKWWLIPILLIFILLGVLILLSSTGLAPFIYTLF